MTESVLAEGDRIRIDVPDETDPDHRLHGTHGRISAIIEDDAGEATGDDRDSAIYRIETDDDETVDVRWRDLRPAFDE